MVFIDLQYSLLSALQSKFTPIVLIHDNPDDFEGTDIDFGSLSYVVDFKNFDPFNEFELEWVSVMLKEIGEKYESVLKHNNYYTLPFRYFKTDSNVIIGWEKILERDI